MPWAIRICLTADEVDAIFYGADVPEEYRSEFWMHIFYRQQRRRIWKMRWQRQYLKYMFLFATGGLIYNLIEFAWRGWTHWTMFLLGGACFILLGLINEIIPWDMALWQQVLLGGCIVTALEFLTGCIVNLCLGWGIWDYSNMPGNILGQICPQYFALWIPVSLAAIVLDDWLRYWWYGEEKPHYKIM